MRRDFTYVDDVAEAVVRVHGRDPEPNPEWDSDCPDPATSNAPFRIYNIGNSEPVELNHFIAVLETLLGKTAIRENLPLQPGDVLSTSADTSDLEAATGFRPRPASKTASPNSSSGTGITTGRESGVDRGLFRPFAAG